MYIPYSTIPCHTTMPYHAYPNIPQYHTMHTPPYIYHTMSIGYLPCSLFPLPYYIY